MRRTSASISVHHDGASMRHADLRGRLCERIAGANIAATHVCHDTEFALCAASTCIATGGTVKNNQGKKYPARHANVRSSWATMSQTSTAAI